MATEAEHRKKANNNRSFLNEIDSVAFADWFATVAFYTALHHIEILAARQNVHNGGHRARNQWVKHTYPMVWRDFRPLLDLSMNARYGPGNLSAADVADATRYLESIVAAVPAN